MTQLILNPSLKNVNPAAFSGELICPYCQQNKWQFVEKAGRPTYLRYRCKNEKCQKTIIYDISNRPEHPYTPYEKNSKFKQIIERSKTGGQSRSR